MLTGWVFYASLQSGSLGILQAIAVTTSAWQTCLMSWKALNCHYHHYHHKYQHHYLQLDYCCHHYDYSESCYCWFFVLNVLACVLLACGGANTHTDVGG